MVGEKQEKVGSREKAFKATSNARTTCHTIESTNDCVKIAGLLSFS